MNSSPSNNTSS